VLYLVLDPHISYEGMKSDYADDNILTKYLESAKVSLHTYFHENYAGKHVTPPVHHHSTAGPSKSWQSYNESPQKVNFTARYKKQPSARRDQLEEYFMLPHEDFNTCDPISWWIGCRSQFPDIFVFACDLLAIPGESVAMHFVN
jgi:hAT family C-terminal dimerisation region